MLAHPPPVEAGAGEAAIRALAASGVPLLTGWPGGPPLLPPPAFAARLGALTAGIAARSAASGRRVDLDWGVVLTGRAALLGWGRAGTTSANGTCRLLPSADGWIALNLARPDDVEALPALLAPAGGGAVDPVDPWPAARAGVAALTSQQLVEQATLLGLPLAALPLGGPRRAAGRGRPWRAEARWERRGPISLEGLRVVDLSSLWAGPLASRVLAAAGADVTKVELAGRPDGARRRPELYRWLHAGGQAEVVLDASSPAGRRRLHALVAGADVVVESGRARALAQLGAGPDDVAPRAGRVWLAISGHGRGPAPGRAPAPGRVAFGDGPGRVAFGDGPGRVAFGDDAAVGGGLVGWSPAPPSAEPAAPGAARRDRPDRSVPVFVADAVADPATGLVGAAAVLDALAGGGGLLLDVALGATAAWLAAPPLHPLHPDAQPVVVRRPGSGWDLEADGVRAPILAPVAAPPVPV